MPTCRDSREKKIQPFVYFLPKKSQSLHRGQIKKIVLNSDSENFSLTN